MSDYYVNPLGAIKDISYNYVKPFKENKNTIDERLNNSEKNLYFNKILFYILISITHIFLIIFLFLFRQIYV